MITLADPIDLDITTDMINKLDITTGFKDGRTYLKDNYFTRPFRLANVGEDRSDPALYLVIMSSSPGILDNDHYDIDIVVEGGSRLQLQSQSYQRLFNMKDGADQKMNIQLQHGSELSYIQHPVVPHEHSIFTAHNRIDMSDDTIFTYGEIITCGRKHYGEIFRFKKFQNLTEVYHNNKIILKDNILIEPDALDVNAMGQVEGYTHQATLLHVDKRTGDVSELVEFAHNLLAEEKDIIFGVSQPSPDTMVIRVLGNGGEQLFSIFKSIEKHLWALNKIYLD